MVRDFGEEVGREVPTWDAVVSGTGADDAAEVLDVRASPLLKERKQAARVEDHDERVPKGAASSQMLRQLDGRFLVESSNLGRP